VRAEQPTPILIPTCPHPPSKFPFAMFALGTLFDVSFFLFLSLSFCVCCLLPNKKRSQKEREKKTRRRKERKRRKGRKKGEEGEGVGGVCTFFSFFSSIDFIVLDWLA
jgi:hypothetical protein